MATKTTAPAAPTEPAAAIPALAAKVETAEDLRRRRAGIASFI